MAFLLEGKIRVSMSQPEFQLALDKSYLNIRALTFNWLAYNTLSAGGTDLKIQCPEIGSSGVHQQKDKSNVKYLLSVPIDASQDVSCVYQSPPNAFDIILRNPVSFDQFTFKAFIGRFPALDVSPTNTIEFELFLYS